MRTEDDKLCKSALTVILGGKEYEVKPLVIRDSREWRKGVVKAISVLPTTAPDTPERFANAINQMLSTMPDTVIDLFFGYAKDLNREEIESVATDDEIAAAFGQVVDVAFPLAKSLVGTMTRISR